ncbi:MAG: hypothetical protein FJ303_19050 [Planctomycetes bacterium]|nr:hypothetical protein [Planctomycetota bacterium]
METNGKPLVAPNLRAFDENRAKFPADKLSAFSGKHVAWSLDGTRILVFGNTRTELDEKVEAAGLAYDEVVHDYIDPPLG